MAWCIASFLSGFHLMPPDSVFGIRHRVYYTVTSLHGPPPHPLPQHWTLGVPHGTPPPSIGHPRPLTRKCAIHPLSVGLPPRVPRQAGPGLGPKSGSLQSLAMPHEGPPPAEGPGVASKRPSLDAPEGVRHASSSSSSSPRVGEASLARAATPASWPAPAASQARVATPADEPAPAASAARAATPANGPAPAAGPAAPQPAIRADTPGQPPVPADDRMQRISRTHATFIRAFQKQWLATRLRTDQVRSA